MSSIAAEAMNQSQKISDAAYTAARQELRRGLATAAGLGDAGRIKEYKAVIRQAYRDYQEAIARACAAHEVALRAVGLIRSARHTRKGG